jgi:hypothetical protein
MKNIISGMGLAALLTVAPAHAALIVGGSALLDQNSANQLESWLGSGSGSLTLTNIFTKGAGSTGASFHAAADGLGSTFVVMNVTQNGVNKTIGGYNPLSWNSSGSYNIAANPADRTAFLFNLSNLTLYSESTGSTGQYQTYNTGAYGPIFGGGFDLYVDPGLASGLSNLYSYGSAADQFNSIVDGNPYAGRTFSINGLEVFSLVPEPGSYPLLLTGLCLIGYAARRRNGA